MADSSPVDVRPAIELRWRVHLARRRPLRAAACAFFIVSSGAVAYALFGHPLAAAVGAFLVFAAAAEFLLPVSYRLGPQGVWCSSFLSLRHMKWGDVRHCYRDAEGIKLSPLSRPSRLEAYRGIYLWLDGDGAEVVHAIRAYLGKGAAG